MASSVSGSRKKVNRKWIQKDIKQENLKTWQLPIFLEEGLSPVQLFEFFYDEAVVNMLVNFTNTYAHQHSDTTFHVTGEEMRIFLAILLLTGYNPLPRYRMYWEMSEDCHNLAVSKAMSRGRFEKIVKYLHICDNNNLSQDDKFSKVRPLWKMLNERWLRAFNNEKLLCIDEAMIPYYGRHGTKQHMTGKPIRFGYKVWCLCTRLGYLVQAEPYQGATTGNTRPEIGVGGSVVLDLVSILPNEDKQGYDFFFDNFFTSLPLLDALKEKGCTGTGTIRSNRIEGAPLKNPKQMKKEPRGTYHQLSDDKCGMTLIRYHDNSIVTVASNRSGIQPTGKYKRYSRAERKYKEIITASVIVNYNTYMGGVDRLDENIANYRINFRSKKWYYQLFAFPLNASVNNAWLLYRQTPQFKDSPLDLLGFTRYIVNCYFQKYTSRQSPGNPIRNPKPVHKRVLNDVRYDGQDHLILPLGKQMRCGQCKKNTTKQCRKCKVPLHANCFLQFHTKQ